MNWHGDNWRQEEFERLLNELHEREKKTLYGYLQEYQKAKDELIRVIGELLVKPILDFLSDFIKRLREV